MGGLRRVWHRLAEQARRITGFSTPFGGIQLRPPSDTSFSRAQDERQLMDEIWLLAGSEAYRAKDAARRLQEMTAQSRLRVMEAYFAANPEVKRWVDRNIEAGTCAAAVSELREKKEEWRQEQRGEAVQRPERDPAFEWLREAARGCAKGGEGMGHDRPNPDMDWYAGVSWVRNVTPRCPFVSVGRCPRYYQSRSLLGQAGSTKIEPDEDERLKTIWEESDLWPRTAEEETSITRIGEETRGFENFCPEVSYERFHLFASYLHRYSDEIDIEFAHQQLGRAGVAGTNWQWTWSSVSPMHFTECPLYSPLTSGSGLPPRTSAEVTERAEVVNEKPADLLALKPAIYGVGIDLKEAGRRLRKRFQRRKGKSS